ncbi:3,4-dihydroxy-2-butanone-4-phosphate synthase [Saccharopolyspora thermophila]|uniref:3,4-dihydroxy-2-butanone-4-phosphate synthase n=1 Tax=Saccharopolyspora thermophila TaxID=89367 RepID=UPI00166494F0
MFVLDARPVCRFAPPWRVMPLRAKPGGVLERVGHTEAGGRRLVVTNSDAAHRSRHQRHRSCQRLRLRTPHSAPPRRG